MSISNHLFDKFYKAFENGQLDECKSIYRMSIEMRKPIDLHQDDEYLFLMACYRNRLAFAKWLYEECNENGYPINIYAQNNYAFHITHRQKFNELYKWLYDLYREHVKRVNN